MMHGMKTFALAAVLAATALSAGAATMTSVVATSTQGVGNTADVYGAGYGNNTPVGATWSSDPTVLVPPGNVGGVYQTPFNNTSLQESQSYFSVGAESGDAGSASPNTLTFAGAGVSVFDILWGSIDSYNTLSFSNGFSIDGTQLAALLGFGAGPTNYEQVALVHFAFDTAVTSATFTSTSAAFEFALAPVPVPAGGLLLLGAMGGLAALRRRKAV